jgi:hypothetical protein
MRGALLVFGAVVVGIIGLQILDDSGGSPSSAPATVETTTPGSKSAVHTNQSEVTIKVYNASDVQGAGAALSDKLAGFGFTMLSSENYTPTRKGTVVECRTGFEADGKVIAAFGIGNGATEAAFPSDPPPNSGDADCVVILGTA